MQFIMGNFPVNEIAYRGNILNGFLKDLGVEMSRNNSRLIWFLLPHRHFVFAHLDCITLGILSQ